MKYELNTLYKFPICVYKALLCPARLVNDLRYREDEIQHPTAEQVAANPEYHLKCNVYFPHRSRKGKKKSHMFAKFDSSGFIVRQAVVQIVKKANVKASNSCFLTALMIMMVLFDRSIVKIKAR